jgi:hypothetical protein
MIFLGTGEGELGLYDILGHRRRRARVIWYIYPWIVMQPPNAKHSLTSNMSCITKKKTKKLKDLVFIIHQDKYHYEFK